MGVNFAIVGMTLNTANFCREMLFWKEPVADPQAPLLPPPMDNKYINTYKKDVDPNLKK